MAKSQDIQVKEKQELRTSAEQTKPGPVFTPAVDIFESEKEITLMADLPGVRADKLTIDLRDDILSLSGEVSAPEQKGEEGIHLEYEVGTFVRQFTLSEVIDQKHIEASLKDGVLRLSLPKVEKAKPRKISVAAG